MINNAHKTHIIRSSILYLLFAVAFLEYLYLFVKYW